MTWATEFRMIPTTLSVRADLRGAMVALLAQDTPVKAVAGGDRLDQLRLILTDLINGTITVQGAMSLVPRKLPPNASAHAGNKQVFASGWEERLIRTQLSRFYNQAVLEHLEAAGETHCFVPHSSDERPESPCSIALAGQTHLVVELLGRLVASYTHGVRSNEAKIPNHPHCTHVVTPPTS